MTLQEDGQRSDYVLTPPRAAVRGARLEHVETEGLPSRVGPGALALRVHGSQVGGGVLTAR